MPCSEPEKLQCGAAIGTMMRGGMSLSADARGERGNAGEARAVWMGGRRVHGIACGHCPAFFCAGDRSECGGRVDWWRRPNAGRLETFSKDLCWCGSGYQH